MPNTLYKKLKYDGYDTVTELAICDGNGNNIIDTYCKKPFFAIAIPSGTWLRYDEDYPNRFRMKINITTSEGLQLLNLLNYKIDIQSDLDLLTLIMSIGALFTYLCNQDGVVYMYGQFVSTKPGEMKEQFDVICTEVKK